MNLLDIVIGIVLLMFAFAGLRKGIIIEAFYLASFVIGIYGAMFLSDAMSDWLSGVINVAPEYLSLIAFILTFLVFMVVIRYLGRLMSGIVEAIFLGVIDKIGGFIFGAVKGALLVSILIMLLNVFNVSNVIDKDLRRSSKLYTFTEEIANYLYKNHDVVKDSMEKSFNKGKDIIEDVIETSLTK